MKRLNKNKGITLVALIITIIVLLILAVVAIRAVQGDGIIRYAKNAKTEYQAVQVNEDATLDSYLTKLDENAGNGEGGDTGTALTVAEAQTKGVLSTTSNTEVYDEYGNKIVVPAGFKITTDASHVTEGIVIEDVSAGTETVGSQFVWIPVGDVYTTTDETKTEENTKTITLGRYVFSSDGTIDTTLSKTNPSDQLKTSSTSTYYYTEGLKDETTTNSHAKDIVTFISSATTKGGYYLGRYEARTTSSTARASSSDALTTVTSIKANSVYNYVTQAQASERSQSMYVENSNYTSDLVNSYAWDTAIVFIQTFSGDSDYSRQNSLNGSLSTTGTENDKVCNIYDMASNCREWSTETSSNSDFPCVSRGDNSGYGYYYTSVRGDSGATSSYGRNSFRPLIYVGL